MSTARVLVTTNALGGGGGGEGGGGGGGGLNGIGLVAERPPPPRIHPASTVTVPRRPPAMFGCSPCWRPLFVIRAQTKVQLVNPLGIGEERRFVGVEAAIVVQVRVDAPPDQRRVARPAPHALASLNTGQTLAGLPGGGGGGGGTTVFGLLPKSLPVRI